MDLLLNKSKSFEWWVSLLFLFINDTKLSSHVAQISEHINSSNRKIHSNDQMVKIIVNLSNTKWKNNNNSTGHLDHIQKSWLMSIVDTPEKYVSNVDRKVDKRKMRTSLINSSWTLFYCSIRVMYNRVHRSQNKCLMLNSFIPAINTPIFPKNIMKISFLKKISMNYMPELRITLV